MGLIKLLSVLWTDAFAREPTPLRWSARLTLACLGGSLLIVILAWVEMELWL